MLGDARPFPGDRDVAARFAALAREQEATLYAVSLRLCGNPADARDLVQDTFERGLLHFERFQAGTNGRAWLLTLLHNLFIDRCRRAVPLQELREEHSETTSAPVPEPASSWSRFGAEDLQRAVDALKPDFRRVYQLHAVEGRSYQEIADSLQIAKATVGTRLIRARRRLKELLLGTQPDPEGEAGDAERDPGRGAPR